MQRSIAVALLVLLLGVGAFFYFWGGDEAPIAPQGSGANPVAEVGEAAANASDDRNGGQPVDGTQQRTEVATAAPDLLDDPEIRAGLSGFRGRVVNHANAPVADCGVRFYRGAMDVILSEKIDLFADRATVEPNYIAGETQTAEDGTFLISGVWPHALYIMFAGLGTDAPMHEVVTKTPSPGEIIDLGDIVLPDAGVIVGTVVDSEGEPLAGALVRAADIPGAVASFVPLERFDPEGAILIRENNSPVSVVEMPHWVKSAFEHVPIPTTLTGSDGTFRLVGVIPGSNLLATTADDHLADVKPSVRVRAGEEKDVGTIRLREGEELIGKVVDTAGEAIADAEVFAGSTIGMAPVDMARKLPNTNDKGLFSGLGFATGKVSVAARRGPGHAWVLAEPQSILSDVVVTLPATFGVDVTVTLHDGSPAKETRFKLLHGDDGAAELAVFGFVPPVKLDDRLHKHEKNEGQWRIDNLLEGKYTLVADAPGYALSHLEFNISEADATAALQLELRREFTVRVVDHENKPIRNAAIYGEARGKRLFDMPTTCGRTKKDGTLVVDEFNAEEIRVSAEHPKWGVVHGLAKLNEELLLRMLPPGSLEGVLTDSGAPPEFGKWTVMVEWQRGDGPRGPFEQVSRMVSPDREGKFRVAALQPGQYRLETMDALSGLRSPGGMVQMMMAQRMFNGNRNRETVDIISGQTTQAYLDSGEKPITGPTAHVFGSVMVNGRLAEGYMVQGRIGSRRYSATVDRSGRFDLGTVPAENAWVSISSSEGLMGLTGASIWSDNFELKENEERELRIDINTSSISGLVYDRSGAQLTGMHVMAQGRTKDGDNDVYLHAPVTAQGAFEFDTVPEGRWTLEIRGGGERSMRGKVEGIVVAAGSPVTGLRIEVVPSIMVKGRIDLAMFGATRPRWAWISIHKLNADGTVGDQLNGIGVDMDDGEFSTDDLGVGSYAVRVHGGGENNNGSWRCQNLDVPGQGLEGVVLSGKPE